MSTQESTGDADNPAIELKHPQRKHQHEDSTDIEPAQKRKASDTSEASRDEASTKRLKVVEDGKVALEPTEDSAERPGDVTGAQNGHSRNAQGESFSPKGKDSSPERRRVGSDKADPPPPTGDRQRNFSAEEKKRGQRLFGGLLSTLSQRPSGTQQKRRQEIERRQHERASQQRTEDDKRRVEKLAKLNNARKIEQTRFEERVMRNRHANILAMAKSLYTKAEPRLYYRPWELTPEQKEKIQAQVEEAEATVEREVGEFKQAKESRLEDLGVVAHHPAVATSDGPAGEPATERPDLTERSDTANRASTSSKHGHEREHDENADEMVEAEEDTVIY